MKTKSRIHERLIELLLDYAPEYAGIEAMGSKALPHLKRIIEVEEALMAGKAAYVAARIGSIHTPPLLDAALARKELGVHVALLMGVRSVALRGGKYEKRQASHKHRHCLLQTINFMLEKPDSVIKQMATDARTRFEAADAKQNSGKKPRISGKGAAGKSGEIPLRGS